jgi:hypothetical protein
MDAARPMHTVLTSGLMWRIVSNTAMPAAFVPKQGSIDTRRAVSTAVTCKQDRSRHAAALRTTPCAQSDLLLAYMRNGNNDIF